MEPPTRTTVGLSPRAAADSVGSGVFVGASVSVDFGVFVRVCVSVFVGVGGVTPDRIKLVDVVGVASERKVFVGRGVAV